MPPTDYQPLQSTKYRIVPFAFGTLFAACAVTILLAVEFSVGALIAGIGVGVLGLDAMISTIRGTTLLARIGPLP